MESKFDVNEDGLLTKEDLEKAKQMLEIEIREEKSDVQRKMAWIALFSILLATIFLFAPIVPESRVHALAEVLGLFYIAQAGVIGAYMGFSTLSSAGRK